MITTVRPATTDKTNGTVSVVGTGGAHGVTDDAPLDDASYITSAQSGAGVWLGVGDLTLTATQRIKQARARIRCFHNSADVGHRDEVDFRFRDGTYGKTSTATTLGTYSNTGVEVATGWYTVYPGNAEWTEARFDRVQADFAWRARSTGLTQLRVSEVYVDADIHEQLVISSITITGNTSSSKPTFAWALNTDPDGDVQTRWQAKVYSAAQYGAANFNPATSPVTWDSGVRSGSITTGVVEVNLVDGVTYRVYMRVAKNWVPSGTLWWSNWANSSSFAISLTAPAKPVLTVTQELTIPSYRNRLVATITGINDLTADTASFENNNIGTWVAGANTNTPTVSGTNPKSGAFSMLLTSTAAGNIEALSGTFATSRRIKPGAVISPTVSTRAVTVARTVQVGVRWFDVTGATISTPMSAGNANATGAYTTHTLANQTAPANAYSYVIRVLILAAAAGGEQHRLDEAGAIRGSSATWSQGGYVDTGTVTFSRLLPVTPETDRGPALNWLHEQVRSGGALLRSTDGFYPRATTDEVIHRQLDRAHPGNPDTAGDGMIDWLIRAGATSFLDIGAPNGTATDFTHPYLFPVVPGVPFTWGAWAWADSAGRAVRYIITWVDEINTAVGSVVNSSIFTLGTATSAVTVAGTPPAGAVFARVAVENNAGAGAVNWRHFITGIWFRPTTPNTPACETIVPWDGMLPAQVGELELEIVRGGEAVALPTDGDPAVVLYDHEAPPDRPVIYTARLVASNLSGDPISSPQSDGISVFMTPPARTLLKNPYDPTRAAVVNVTKPSAQGRNLVEDVAELHGLGRDGDPVFIRAWYGHERLFELTTNTYLESLRLERLVTSSRSLLVQWSDGGQTYLRIKSPSAVRFTRGKDRVAITAAETKRPI